MLRTIYTGFIMTLGLSMIGSFSYAQVLTTHDFDKFMSDIQLSMSLDWQRQGQTGLPTLRQNVFENFCRAIKDLGKTSPTYKDATTYYHPAHSVFIHIVCRPFENETSFKPLSDKDQRTYFLKDDWRTLGIYGPDNQTCNPGLAMSQCDVSRVMTELMHRILNDVFDIMQASIYGARNPDPNPIKQINNYTQSQLVGFELCPNNNCNMYPKTKNRLSAYMKKAKKLLDTIDIVHQAYIMDVISDAKINNSPLDCSFPSTSQDHIFLCAFGSQDRVSLDGFVRMINNEMFFYRLFMASYVGRVESERRLLGSNTGTDQISIRIADVIASTQQQVSWTQEAVDMSIKMLREMYTTFPIHIGLLIYYEDLYSLRKQLVKVVTPMYTLYDKLRNVQQKDE